MDLEPYRILGQYTAHLLEMFSRDRAIDHWVGFEHPVNGLSMAPEGHSILQGYSRQMKARLDGAQLFIALLANGEVTHQAAMPIERRVQPLVRIGAPAVAIDGHSEHYKPAVMAFCKGMSEHRYGGTIISEWLDLTFTPANPSQ